MRVFVYGVPGVGKTFLTRQWGKQLNLPIIEADRQRKEAQASTSKQTDPFLYTSTCKAYKMFGNLTWDNAVKGLMAVRKSLQDVVWEKAESSNAFIMEAAFLNPTFLRNLGKMILITCQNEDKHRKQFLTHREKLLDVAGEEFSAARLVQQFLVQEADEFKIDVVDNSESGPKVPWIGQV